MPADHDDGEIRVLAAQQFEQLHPVQIAALQPNIQYHQCGLRTGLEHRECRGAITRHTGLIAFILQDSRHQQPDILFVVDNENVVWQSSKTRYPFS